MNTKLSELTTGVYAAPGGLQDGAVDAAIKEINSTPADVHTVHAHMLWRYFTDPGETGYILCPAAKVTNSKAVEFKNDHWHFPPEFECVHPGGGNVYVPKKGGDPTTLLVKKQGVSFSTHADDAKAREALDKVGGHRFIGQATDGKWFTIHHA